MKKRLVTILVPFLVSVSACTEKVDVEADIQALTELTDKVEALWNAGDITNYMDLVDDDAIWLPPNEPAVFGKEAVRGWLDFENYDYEVKITIEEIQVHGDWALKREFWEGINIPKDGSPRTAFSNKNLVLLRRSSDGQWKIWYAIFNSILPLVPSE